ncbi:MAG TPA: MFS transporter [Candidatus Limnocylindria bacterium]|nr:MFS transporter [Candidatus Limnocylindria bacterium]
MIRRRLGVLGQPPFAAFWTGGALSNTGTWLGNVAASVFVYDQTGSALAVGVLNFVTFLPVLLFSLTGGVLSDRFDRRAIVVATHAASGALSLALAGLIAAGAATEVHVIAVMFLLQTSWAVAKPSLTAMVPALVRRDEVPEAVGLNTLQFLAGQLAGPLVAVVVLGTWGYAAAFAANALTYAGPVLAMAFLARRGLGAGAASRAREAARAGAAAFIRAEPWVLAALLAVVVTSALLEVIRTLAPVIVAERIGAPTNEAGVIIAAQSFGSVLGIALLAPLRRRDLSRASAAAGLALQAAGLVAVSGATSMPAAVASVLAVGMGFGLSFTVVTSALQTEVPDALRGRLMSLHQMALLGNRPFTALAAGALAATFGVPAAALAAVAFAPLGLAAVRSAWHRLDVPPRAPTDAAVPAD